MEVMGIGTASEIHHVNIHARTPSIFPLVAGASNFAKTQITAQSKGPNRMKKFFQVKMDLIVELKLYDL